MLQRIKVRLLAALLLGSLLIGWRSPQAPTVQSLVEPVNMTFNDDRLFVSDRHTGVHVYDVADRAAPQHAMTIPLKYNSGTAIKDDILYANEYSSLLVIRIGEDSYEVVKRIGEEHPYPDLPNPLPQTVDTGFGCQCAARDTPSFATAPIGNAGSSFATFAIIDDYLYYLDYQTLITADISTPDDPKVIGRTYIGWTIETLYPTAEFLFVGGTLGMYIFDRSNPAMPVKIGEVQHFRACDPVVVSGNMAYVTLRGGSRCGDNRDVLLSVDIAKPNQPTIVGEKEMSTPYGLAVEDHLLYVSTGSSGFELLDVVTPASPSKVKAWPDRSTKDFIWLGNTLYTLGFDNVMIFDVTTPDEPVLLSEITLNANS
jgi:hypothetical protein